MRYLGTDISQPIISIDATNIGLILLWPSGVLYSNQSGGYACLHPMIEGVYASLELPEQERTVLEGYFTGTKWAGWCFQGIDVETADFLDSLFAQSENLYFLRVDRDCLRDSYEAWIYVNVTEPEGNPGLNPFAGFGNCRAVLTWENSD